ncbi:TraB/GumN family protein [Candidatus Woesearchaeota archaeon]|nr:TraB/GumN family protein [Candidatus Woesearchaeota archaeon]
MQSINNLTIIGTSHISIQSVREIKHFVEAEKPDIICLELDRNRFHALLQKQPSKLKLRDIRKIGLKGFFFMMIGGWIERTLGRKVGLTPGAEMKQAIALAKKHNISLALIDQDIIITMKKLKFSTKEKLHLIKDVFKSIFFKKRELKRLGLTEFDLTKVPEEEVIEKMIKEVKDRYPNFYKTLIEDRNKIMAKRIAKLIKTYPEKKILAVVGAGHEKAMHRLIKNYLNKDNIKTYNAITHKNQEKV